MYAKVIDTIYTKEFIGLIDKEENGVLWVEFKHRTDDEINYISISNEYLQEQLNKQEWYLNDDVFSNVICLTRLDN